MQKYLRAFVLTLVALWALPMVAHAKTAGGYQMKCDLGKDARQTRAVAQFEIELSPINNSCHLSISANEDRRTVFEYISTWIEVFADGTDFNGDGAPDAVVQVAATSPDYKLFVVSLGKNPGLVQTIENNYGFWLRDCQGDRRLRIWTADGAFYDSPELKDIYLYDVVVPEVIFRLEGDALIDATPECARYFDSVIARASSELTNARIAAFKAGKIHDPFRKGRIKGNVLTIVFSYLYTGRESQALQALERMWPASDRNRVWDWMRKLRSEGVLRQTTSR